MIQILIKVKFNLKHLMGKKYSLLTEIIDLLFKGKKNNAIDTNYFITFLQNANVTNILLVFI